MHPGRTRQTLLIWVTGLLMVSSAGCANWNPFGHDHVADNPWEPDHGTHLGRVKYYRHQGYNQERAEELANEDAFSEYIRDVRRQESAMPNPF